MQKVPLPTGWVRWEMSVGGVTLYRMPNVAAREEWIYLIRFHAVYKGPETRSAPYPEVYVPVRMDGTIPEPVVEKKNP